MEIEFEIAADFLQEVLYSITLFSQQHSRVLSIRYLLKLFLKSILCSFWFANRQWSLASSFNLHGCGELFNSPF